MAISASFFTDDNHAISSQLDVVQSSLAAPSDDPQVFLDAYEIDNTVEIAKKHRFDPIALQFPDELLHDSVPIYLALKERLPDTEIYILADTTYGSCCVDEVAAQHVDAQLVVHYGHACMSLTSRTPVLYIFGNHLLDTGICLPAFKALLGAELPSHLVLFHSAIYTHTIPEFFVNLKSAFPHTSIYFSPIPDLLVQPRSADDPPPTISGQRFLLPPALESLDVPPTILFVGEESLALNNVLLTHPRSPVYSFNPKTNETRLESDRTNKLLMRRYATMQKARDADVFGILVGTLGVANYLPLISHLRSLITKAQRKFYTISVGKINPAKLANFPEIECYVLVACPENSIVESKDFARPIVTPYELYLALQPEPTWTGKLVLDFDIVMSETTKESQTETTTVEDEDKPDFSLITGKYRSKKRFGTAKEEGDPQASIEIGEQSSTLVRTEQERGLTSRYRNPIGEYLQSREYQGLDPRIGLDEPAKLEQGRSGIAGGYTDDHPGPPTENSDSEPS